MKKKIALALISLLTLTILLTTTFYVQGPSAEEPAQGTSAQSSSTMYHWKIMLAQKGCNARIKGNLTIDGLYIPGTDFVLECVCGEPEPQKLGQFVFWKVNTSVVPNDIHYIKYVDVDKDGIWDFSEPIKHPIPLNPEEPHTVYEHVEEGTGPFGPWMVVVEVREQPYDEERPFFEWQLTLTQKQDVIAWWTGFLTDKFGIYIPGTDFDIVCDGTQQQCVVVKTPWCTVPHDVHYTLSVDYNKDGLWDEKEYVEADITQFPWVTKKHRELDLQFWPPKVVNLGDPTCTIWEELHPQKFNLYHVTSWEPGMVLSPCDQIDMEQVEPPGLIEDFHVDDVTVDLVVYDIDTGGYRYLDYKCGYWVFKDEVEENPICSKWNELYPDHGRCWHLTSWIDNGDGKLSPCDTIEMTPMCPEPGPVSYCHVEEVTVTLKLTKKPLEPPLQQYYLEFMGTLDEFEAMDYIHYPICTMWHEIWPVFSRIWHLSSWDDTLGLSPSDQIYIEPIEPPGPIEEYHVDKLTVAMNMTSLEPPFDPPWRIVKFEGSLEQFKLHHWENAVSTQWHEVNPEYCRQWHLDFWLDDGDGFLGYCDEIWMIDKETCVVEPFHVETLSTDMWVTTKTPKVELEITEVQMYHYIVMGGQAENCADLPIAAAMIWNVPYASRPPDYTPLQEQSLNITFTQRDPITGIVKLSVPAESFVGINHVFYSNNTNQYYNVSTFLLEQGCGYLFTGDGKNPILGDVNLVTWNNDTGVYSNKTGQLIELGPCLQNLTGSDGVPGTGDLGDIFGDGTPDGNGSSLLYLNTIVRSDWALPNPGHACLPPPAWFLLYEAPYPQLYTTATTNDTVVEDQSELNGLIASAKGEPWEFVAGLQGYDPVLWKHPKCNAYVIYANAWSLLNVPTSLGDLDLLWKVTFKLVREDCVIADINCDEVVNIKDIVTCALAFGAKDETWCKPYADPNFDASGDLMPPKGTINIKDIVRIAIDFGARLTPNCIIRP